MATKKTAGPGPASTPLLREALLRSLERESDGPNRVQRLQLVADALVDAGIDREMPALRELFQRVDGKISEAPSGGEGRGPADLEVRWPTEAKKKKGRAAAAKGADASKP